MLKDTVMIDVGGESRSISATLAQAFSDLHLDFEDPADVDVVSIA